MTITIRPNAILEWALQIYNSNPYLVIYLLIGIIATPIILLIASRMRDHEVKWYEPLLASVIIIGFWPLLTIVALAALITLCGFSLARLFKEDV